MGCDPQPGRALLCVAQGKMDAVLRGLERSLDELQGESLARARLLPAAVEIAVAVGNDYTARDYVGELEATAGRFGSTALAAAAAAARGQVALAMGALDTAISSLRRAVQLWTGIELPYEAARARIDLGRAYRADGDGHHAELELRAARAALDRLGARREVELRGRAAPIEVATVDWRPA